MWRAQDATDGIRYETIGRMLGDDAVAQAAASGAHMSHKPFNPKP